MGKPRKHTSLSDMSEPVKGKRRKRQPKPPLFYGGIAGQGTPVVEVPRNERDWYAEGRCATCHRETPKKLLTRNVTLEDKALCGKCFDKVPTHLRRLPTSSGRKGWEYRTLSPTDKQMKKYRQHRNAEHNAILNSIPGTTLAEKLDSVERGLADQDPRFVARDKADWDRFVKERQAERQARYEPAAPKVAESAPVEPVELWRCDHNDCEFTGAYEAIARHGHQSGHLFRSRRAEE